MLAVLFLFPKALRHHVVYVSDDNFSSCFFADFSCENQFARRSRREKSYINDPEPEPPTTTFFSILPIVDKPAEADTKIV